MKISSEQVKQLRAQTGASIMDCNQALQESLGDFAKALEILKKKGALKAEKKAARTAEQGIIEAYVHSNGKIGVLVDLRCETDFVARNEEFKKLAHELALHVAAMNPSYVSRQDVPADILEHERKLYLDEVAGLGKPEKIMNEIVEGKLGKHLEAICFLEQPYVKNPDETIDALIRSYIAKLGENIRVARFIRYEI
ncbi:MAG: Elongation factor Ts [Candidatus Azambacteria bacterium GW2011_GWB2_46_37]|uniref:Elongation factor Ts n=3 Tax=Candidatus Azamiibacteriota TaxID=1752741 RepID=A0A1F5C5Q6_9BACT|nr:MAG: Elongation factor Ts [Candidatus Azambacteria bacterium GW2011_GWB1_46_27]KKU37760.1 MAG: Elongation factor Ts [Candidatus Azambacteria bacterium GW2011_GWB2_46_37]OGD38188.1 MAG: translation elongation factor Ts [Candidatus Azambacteria bacterium RIFCSPLOWO2_01_FULL_46_26]HAM95625.1 translation elongation factor Ts [Candidatus Azambacteria bacterium]HAQ05508.1 translation elongation factor Ts [Candidatus Azambacteria bacterium]